MADDGLLGTQCQRQRRKLAKQCAAEFAALPTGPNQTWQFTTSANTKPLALGPANRRRRRLLLELQVRLALTTDNEGPFRRDRRGQARTSPRYGRRPATRRPSNQSQHRLDGQPLWPPTTTSHSSRSTSSALPPVPATSCPQQGLKTPSQSRTRRARPLESEA